MASRNLLTDKQLFDLLDNTMPSLYDAGISNMQDNILNYKAFWEDVFSKLEPYVDHDILVNAFKKTLQKTSRYMYTDDEEAKVIKAQKPSILKSAPPINSEGKEINRKMNKNTYLWFIKTVRDDYSLNRFTSELNKADEPKLTECPDCEHKISKLARTCPNCGRPFNG